MDDNLKTYLEGLNGAFEEFKATNDQRLAEIEKKGEADPLVESKLAKIEADLDRFENVNQKLVQQEKAAEGFAEKLDSIETMLKRPNSGAEVKEIDLSLKAWDKFMRKGKIGDWKNHFDQETVEKFSKWEAKWLQGTDFQFRYE